MGKTLEGAKIFRDYGIISVYNIYGPLYFCEIFN